MFIFITLLSLVSAFDQTKCAKLVEILGTQELLVELTPQEMLDCLQTLSVTDDQKKIILNNVDEYTNAYAFKDILKNPPEPYTGEEYYETLDIDAEIATIRAKEYTNFYDLLYDITNMIVKTRDSHINFMVTGEGETEFNVLAVCFYATPFAFNIDDEKNVYLIPNGNFEQYGLQVPAEINTHSSEKVKFINNESPDQFIREYGKKFVALKSPHAQFTYAKQAMTFGSFGSSPLPREYIEQDIVVTYENDAGETTEVTYHFTTAFVNPAALSRRAKNALDKYHHSSSFPLLKIDEILETEEIYEKKMAMKKETNRLYEEGDDVYCYVHTQDEVNTFVLSTFAPESSKRNEFIQVIKDCAETFDQNEYPIQIILPMNEGGEVELEQMIEKLFAPHDDVGFIGSMRISDLNELLVSIGYGTLLRTVDECIARANENDKEIGEWYTSPETVKYGDITHVKSQPSQFGFNYKNQIKMTRHKRKPTEIVVYTDSYCYSCCSIFTKGLKEHGSAIIVGYNGDYSQDGTEKFEVGQSPTTVIDLYNMVTDKSKNPFMALGLNMRYSFLESFRYNYDLDEKDPREFLIDEVDVRAPFNSYSDDKLGDFILFTKDIVQQFQQSCNPNSPRLMKVDSTCDDQIKILAPNAVGGHKCLQNSKWDPECSIAHCEDGYKYDVANNRCIVDACVENYGKGPSSGSLSTSILLLIAFLMMILF